MPALALLTTRARPIEPKPDPRDRPDTYPKGRSCLDPECITILCQWNPGPWCYLHAQRIESQVTAECAA